MLLEQSRCRGAADTWTAPSDANLTSWVKIFWAYRCRISRQQYQVQILCAGPCRISHLVPLLHLQIDFYVHRLALFHATESTCCCCCCCCYYYYCCCCCCCCYSEHPSPCRVPDVCGIPELQTLPRCASCWHAAEAMTFDLLSQKRKSDRESLCLCRRSLQ